MNPQFSQAGGSVSKDVNKQSIARVFSKKKSDITYLKVGSSVNGYAILFEPTTQTCWFRGTATGNPVSWTINNDVMTLVTSGGSFTLNKAQVWDSVTLSGANATSLIGTPSGGTLANLLLRTISPAEFGLENDPTGAKADKIPWLSKRLFVTSTLWAADACCSPQDNTRFVMGSGCLTIFLLT